MTREFFKIRDGLPELGVGVGLRREILDETLESTADIDWVEITPEAYLGCHGKSMARLERAASVFPFISHGVNLSLGSTDELNKDYLIQLKQLLDTFNVAWWSDHVSFASFDSVYVNNLLPLPRNDRTVKHFVQRIRQAQEFICRPILIENISFYMPNPPGTSMSEAEFLTEILETADCGMLLDVNNVYVNSVNHGFDPFDFIKQLPLDRVVQIHVAGHNYHENTIIDTHSEAVCEPVFDLLAFVLNRVRPKGVMLERDDNFPSFDKILDEVKRIRQIFEGSLMYNTESVAEKERAIEVLGARASDSSEPTKTDADVDLASVEKVFSKVVLDRIDRDEIVSAAESDLPDAGGFCSRHAEQLDLYGRITDAGALATMQCIFPVTKKLLGEKTWEWAIAEYYHRHPPSRFVLASVGQFFPQFLQSVKDYLPSEFVLEMADFEWTRMAIVEQEVHWTDLPAPQFTRGADLAGRKPVLNPSLIVKEYSFNVVELFDSLLYHDVAEVEVGGQTKIAFLRNSEDQEVMIFEVASRMDMLLTEITKSRSYSELFARLLKREGATDPVRQIMDYTEELGNLHKWNLIAGDELIGAGAAAS